MTSPPAIPDHTLLRAIGRGAYGEVWLARNVMGVLRAVKIVERKQFDSDRPYQREFAGIQRYEPVSRLADGLVHVLHVGRNDAAGYFYYVMELADSVSNASASEQIAVQPEVYSPRTLRADLKRLHRLPIADCLRVALDVVSGLARLHEQGLVHRDVKPGNIIFVNGRAKLADIGLVSTHAEGRTFVGTEGYIPPEGPGSPVADLYALGMCLYEAATGYSPEDFPKVPAEWFAENTGTEALEFHEIVLKACEGDRERRYQSAEQMQADLALLQSGQSVRHVRMLERRAARTQRFAWVGGMVVLIAVATTLIANWRARIAETMRQRESVLLHEAREARARAESADRDAHQQLNVSLFEQARALVLSKELGHRTRALDALRRAKGATNVTELRRVALAALTLPDLQLESVMNIDPATTLLQFDPTFERVALGRGREPVTICSVPDLKVLATLPPGSNHDAYFGAWSADGRFLAVKRHHDVNGVRADWEVWNVGTTQRVLMIRPDVAHNSVTFHPSKPLFMTGHGGGRVTEWSLEDGQEVRRFKFPGTPHALAYSPDGRRIAASYKLSSTNWVIAFHDATNLEVLRAVDYPEAMEFVAWHPQGRWFHGTAANASPWARGVRLIDSNSRTIITLGEHKIKTALGEFTADGDYLVSGGWDREIVCWDLQNLQRAFTYVSTGYRHFWSRDGRRCAVVLPTGALEFFNFVRPGHRNLSGNPGHALQEARFSPDGRWLVARDDKQLCVWDLQRNAPAALVSVQPNAGAFFSPDSTELFVVSEVSQRRELRRWRITPGGALDASPQLESQPVQFPQGLISATSMGNELAMISAEGARFVALTNLGRGEGRIVRVPAGVGCVSPDSRWLAMFYSYSPEVGIYRLPDMEEVARLQTSNWVQSITFSTTGDEMLVLNRSGAEWFDTKTWQATRRQPGAPVSGSYALYTPDGNGIWMVTHFRNVALLDRRTLEPLLPLPKDFLPLALSPDGRQLAVSFEGRRVQLWDVNALRGELAKLGLDW